MKYSQRYYHSPSVRLKSQKGVGLIELMVSIALGLLIMAGVLQLFATSNTNSIASQSASRLQENLRYALARIEDDVAQSGNFGCYSSSFASSIVEDNQGQITPIRNMLADKSGSNDFLGSFASGQHNIASGNADGILEGSDTLTLKYANSGSAIPITSVTNTSLTLDVSHPSYNQLQQGQIVMAGDCTSSAIFIITNDLDDDDDGTNNTNGLIQMATSGTSNDSSDHQIKLSSSLGYLYGGTTGTYEYSIRTAVGATGVCGSAGTARQHCALFRRVGGTVEELVQGVHSFVVEYGVEQPLSGVLAYTTTPTAAQSRNIDRIKLTIIFNAVDASVIDGSGLITKTVERIVSIRNQI